jgi:hypothetical protein
MTLGEVDRPAVLELAPLLRRVVGLDAGVVVRLRMVAGATATAVLHVPFRVLVSRSVAHSGRTTSCDVTVSARGVLDWLDGVADEPPPRQDAEWRWGLPPATGWAAVDSVPDHVIRPLVRRGALTLKETAAREGLPGAQPRAEVADALLDATVLTVSEAGRDARVTLRALSALTRMGFLPRGGRVRVDVSGRWIRVVAEYGTVYLEDRSRGLTVLR